jgi:hypothetical protein
MTTYAKISNIGTIAEDVNTNNPLVYCTSTNLANNFIHTSGTSNGPDSKQCQMFMSDYCAMNWDDACERESRRTSTEIPNMIASCGSGGCGNMSYGGSGINGNPFTKGDILVKNTAMKKYLSQDSQNCVMKYVPFDPQVASSPMISYLEPACNTGACIPQYEVDPATIDSDPVMNHILANPSIALSLLINIYNTANRKGTLAGLNGTRLYRFFMTPLFQSYVSASQARSVLATARGKLY